MNVGEIAEPLKDFLPDDEPVIAETPAEPDEPATPAAPSAPMFYSGDGGDEG